MDDFKPTISQIVCMDKMGLIGQSNKMIWHIPEELKYFKEITKDSIVIMGANTIKSLGLRPLPNRINIIVSGSSDEQDNSNVYVRKSLEESLILAEYLAHKDQKNIFIIGGSSIYNQTINIATKFYITVLDVNLIHKPIINDINSIVYYDFESVLDKPNIKLISEENLNTKSFLYPIHLYVFEEEVLNE